MDINNLNVADESKKWHANFQIDCTSRWLICTPKTDVQIFQNAQWEAFKDDIIKLSKRETVKKLSSIYSFSPLLDADWLLRV